MMNGENGLFSFSNHQVRGWLRSDSPLFNLLLAFLKNSKDVKSSQAQVADVLKLMGESEAAKIVLQTTGR